MFNRLILLGFAGRASVRRIALKSLLHDRGKAFAALAGIAFATTSLLVQSGVSLGFLEARRGPSSASAATRG